MSPAAASSLDLRLESYERSSGHQLIVYIAPTTGDAPIDDWAVRAFEKWKVGRKGIDDGLVLFIMAADRKLRFEVGYGLEPVIPDAMASRVINDVIVPRVQAGDRDGAVTAGMEAVMTVIGGGGFRDSPQCSVPIARRPALPSRSSPHGPASAPPQCVTWSKGGPGDRTPAPPVHWQLPCASTRLTPNNCTGKPAASARRSGLQRRWPPNRPQMRR